MSLLGHQNDEFFDFVTFATFDIKQQVEKWSMRVCLFYQPLD